MYHLLMKKSRLNYDLQYKDNLLDIFKIWEGGIAVYGSIIGAVISTCIYCKVKKIKTTKILDIGAGTGAYSVYLSEEGYDVSAVELVEHNIKIFKKKDIYFYISFSAFSESFFFCFLFSSYIA